MTTALDSGRATAPARTKGKLWSRLRVWLANRRAARRLEAMDEAGLKDIGAAGGIDWMVERGRDI